jgi:phosphoribosylformylglycinamidine synthase I
MIRFAVIQFPGSNCDQDCVAAINSISGAKAEYVWHKQTSLRGFDAIVLPGGFAYGDYLRCGAIARFSPIMQAVVSEARAGKLVLGTCNGFQVLCEAGLLPGALVRNRGLRFVCDMVTMRVEVPDSPFTHGCAERSLLRMPVAHGEGCYFADDATLRELVQEKRVILRYSDNHGRTVPEVNPNGSIENIAGICNRDRNVFGLMPHPDRAADVRLGSADGLVIFRSMMQTIEQARRPDDRPENGPSAPERAVEVGATWRDQSQIPVMGTHPSGDRPPLS